jgi:OOP family OmpA-OmpF porin
VPAIDIKSGLVLFGKGVGNCTGHSMAKQVYGVTTHNTSDFHGALSAIDCTGGSTPSGDALDLTASALEEASGDVAVFIFSDFKWDDAGAVQSAVATMREQHGDRLCLYAVQAGDYRENDALISDITRGNGCGGVVSTTNIASPEAMTAYVAETLMSPVPVVEYERQTLSATTLFKLNSAALSDEGQAELRQLAAYIKGHGSEISDIKITGHTCDLGSERYNQELSLRRARAVATSLAREGVSSDLMDVNGMGESSPIASNANEAGRSQNRRVDVHIGTLKPAGS